MSKYNRTYHLDFSPGATNDDRIADSVDSLIGIPIIITEKLDGENTGMTNDGVYARSHAAFTTSPWSREVRQLHTLKIEGNLEENVFIFGENMEGIHSIEYTDIDSYFYMFGVRDNDIWLSWDKVEEYSYLLDIPTVPILYSGIINSKKELTEIVKRIMSEPSELGGEKEGVVIRKYGQFHNDDFANYLQKWVRRDHVTTDEHWQRNWKKTQIKRVY